MPDTRGWFFGLCKDDQRLKLRSGFPEALHFVTDSLPRLASDVDQQAVSNFIVGAAPCLAGLRSHIPSAVGAWSTCTWTCCTSRAQGFGSRDAIFLAKKTGERTSSDLLNGLGDEAMSLPSCAFEI